MLRTRVLLTGALVLIILAACAPSSPSTVETVQRNPPTPTPLAWQSSGAPITLDNVTRIQPLGRLDQPDTTRTIMDYALAPDGTRLAAISDVQLTVWDMVSGSVVYSSGRSDMTQLFYSPDKTELYGMTPAGEGIVLNADTGAVLNSFLGHPEYSGAASFDSEWGWLALGGFDGVVKVWDPFERTSVATWTAHQAGVSAVAFSTDGERLATAGYDRRVRVWDWQNRTMLHEWATADFDPLRLVWSPDDETLVAGVSDGAFVWSPATGAQLHRLTGGAGADQLLRVSPNGRYVMGGTRGTGISVWTLESGELLSSLPESNGDSVSGDFSPEGTLLVTAAVDRPVSLWNMSRITGATIDRAQLPVATGLVIGVDWTADGRLVLFFDARGFVHVWGIPGAADAGTG